MSAPIPHLWQIAADGSIDQLEDILGRGADVNAFNPSGLTPLMVAAYHGRTEMVKALIEHGADVNATDSEGLTVAIIADEAGHDEILRILVGRAVKRKRPLPVTDTSTSQSAQKQAVDKISESEAPTSTVPQVRTLNEPPDIWDMVHETRTEFDPGSAFFARITVRKFLLPAAILLMISGVGVLCFKVLPFWSGSDAAVSTVRTKSNTPVTNLNQSPTPTETSKASSNQRSLRTSSQTKAAISTIFDPKTLMSGVAGLRSQPMDTYRQQNSTMSQARGSPALFPDVRTKPRKSIPAMANNATGAAIGDKEGVQPANPTAAARKAGKGKDESSTPPKANPSPKAKLIMWP